MKLFLDDIRTAPDSSWAVVRDYDAFVRFMENEPTPDIISFDHDLSDKHYVAYNSGKHDVEFKEKTGYDCAKWIIENQKIPQLAVIHSLNPVGAMNIAQLLRPHCSVVIAPRLMR